MNGGPGLQREIIVL